ncbi:hypothetical protein [uncultured Roseobacter sp.]|uniref:hypothetical protein n=1 Tax=uncultured Roseobacter sp. TaxID=114847 RepID=UPI0026375680|nr:hypothetical protein [uncultured Roseobacter sp.]
MPDGFRNKERRDPLNFTREEWQQARRSKQDPKVLKAVCQECWQTTKTAQQFSSALREHGLYLARGDNLLRLAFRPAFLVFGRC